MFCREFQKKNFVSSSSLELRATAAAAAAFITYTRRTFTTASSGDVCQIVLRVKVFGFRLAARPNLHVFLSTGMGVAARHLRRLLLLDVPRATARRRRERDANENNRAMGAVRLNFML